MNAPKVTAERTGTGSRAVVWVTIDGHASRRVGGNRAARAAVVVVGKMPAYEAHGQQISSSIDVLCRATRESGEAEAARMLSTQYASRGKFANITKTPHEWAIVVAVVDAT